MYMITAKSLGKIALLTSMSLVLALTFFASANIAFAVSPQSSSVVQAEAYAYHEFYAYASGDSFKGTQTFNSYGSFTLYDYNATFKGPEVIYAAPTTLSYEGLPYNSTKGLGDGNTQYTWNEKSTTLTSGSSLSTYFYGSGTLKAPIGITRTATPSTLTCTSPCTTKVTVVAKFTIAKPGAPNLCMEVQDYNDANTSSKLLSVNGHDVLTTYGGVHSDDFAEICMSSVPAGTHTLTSVWNVTKYASGSITWRPGVYASENSYVYCYNGYCYTPPMKPYDTVTNTSKLITYNNNWLHKSYFTFTSSTGTSFDWYYISFSAYLSEYLFVNHA
jgi:hypothetical protein